MTDEEVFLWLVKRGEANTADAAQHFHCGKQHIRSALKRLVTMRLARCAAQKFGRTSHGWVFYPIGRAWVDYQAPENITLLNRMLGIVRPPDGMPSIVHREGE
jgi:predicted ArsR family transcriptional regulator